MRDKPRRAAEGMLSVREDSGARKEEEDAVCAERAEAEEACFRKRVSTRRELSESPEHSRRHPALD